MEVRGDSVLSGLIFFSVLTVADLKFSDKFGITEQEIAPFVSSEEELANVMKYYNGYVAGGSVKLINPNSTSLNRFLSLSISSFLISPIVLEITGIYQMP